MTRDEVLQWLEKELGISHLALGDGGATHRLEWIAVATVLGDWTLDEVKQVIEQTKGIKPMPRRIDEMLRILQRKRWQKWESKSSTQ